MHIHICYHVHAPMAWEVGMGTNLRETFPAFPLLAGGWVEPAPCEDTKLKPGGCHMQFSSEHNFPLLHGRPKQAKMIKQALFAEQIGYLRFNWCLPFLRRLPYKLMQAVGNWGVRLLDGLLTGGKGARLDGWPTIRWGLVSLVVSSLLSVGGTRCYCQC
eukprot:1144399-Pelagomonas_calceolata.AAC.2